MLYHEALILPVYVCMKTIMYAFRLDHNTQGIQIDVIMNIHIIKLIL